MTQTQLARREVEIVKSDLRNIKLFCSRHFPFAVIPLSYMRVVATLNVETCGVDEKGVFYINPVFWETTRQNMPKLRFLVLHEMMHIALLHPSRMKEHDHLAFNVAADAKINDGLVASEVPGIELFSGGLTMAQVAFMLSSDEETLSKMSTEEIVFLYKKKKAEAKMTRDLLKTSENYSSKSGSMPKDGGPGSEVVQEGNLKPEDAESAAKEWRKVLQIAKTFASSVGSFSPGLERILDEITELKPPWRIALRIGIRSCEKTDTSYAYPNRRSDDFPGQISYKYKVWALVDTSGSISQELLSRFLGMLRHEAKNAQVNVIPWDAKAYETITANRPSDIARRVAKLLKGGGGTEILPALKVAARKAKRGDAIVVLTDGHIADIGSEEVKQHFRLLLRSVGFLFIGYTERPVTVPGAVSVMLEGEGE